MRTATLALALLAGAGCDGPPFAASRHGITGGEPTSGDEAVVALGARPVACGEPLEPMCSGTLIAPRVVLSAGHCFARGARDIYAFFGADTAGTGVYRRVLRVEVHPGFDDATNVNDLALLLLDEDAPAAPVALPSAALDDGAVGAPARVVGFGEDDEGLRGRKREGTATVSAVEPGAFRIAAAPGMSCRADSGGPVYVDRGAGDVFSGITSQGDVACAEYADNIDVATHVDDFIAPFVDAATSEPGAREAGAISADAVCAEKCGTDADCPAEMRCVQQPGDDAARCALPGAPPGDLAVACASDGDCDGSCVLVAVDGACACLEICADGGDGGCAGTRGAQVWPLVLALLALAARRRWRATRVT